MHLETDFKLYFDTLLNQAIYRYTITDREKIIYVCFKDNIKLDCFLHKGKRGFVEENVKSADVLNSVLNKMWLSHDTIEFNLAKFKYLLSICGANSEIHN